jgi:MarR family transcriptional regulator, lower aerobic nicotinate degradation pathway regulator
VRRLRPERRLQLATCVLDDIRRIFQTLRIAARRAEQDLGITGAQLFVLQKLADGPAQSLNELAERTLTHQSSVSVVVRRLVERGLVGRDRGDTDARRVELRLTAAGKRLLRQMPTMPQVRLVQTIRAFPDRDLQRMATLMHQMATGIHAARLRPEMLFADTRRRGATRKRSGERLNVAGPGRQR